MEKILETSKKFWEAMEHADADGMRAVADPNCNFVHIGMTCKLEHEIECYTRGLFKPTELVFHDKKVERFGETAIVLTDCDYGLLLGGNPVTHHFAVTEVYVHEAEDKWTLVQFTFSALVH